MSTPPTARHDNADDSYAAPSAVVEADGPQWSAGHADSAESAAMTAEEEEVQRITRKFGKPSRTVALVLIGAIGGYIMMMTMGTALQLRLTLLDEASATTTYSRATSISALLMLFVIPLVGSLSDRTTSRWGRRKPWIVAGYLIATVSFYLIGVTTNRTLIIVAYVVGIAFAQAGFNAYSVIPVEGIPANMRGRVMGFMGMCGALATSAGAYICSALVGNTVLLMCVPPLLAIFCIIPLLVLYKDPVHTKEEVPQGNILSMFRHFFVNPLKHPNFGWVWLARFLAGIAMTAFLNFFVLYLVIGLGNDPAHAGTLAGRLSLMSAPVSIIFFTCSGWISDKLGVRRPFVALAAVVMAGALVLAGTSSSFTVFTIAWIIFAMGQAMYLTVDLALCSQVLPSEADAGKDMAVFGLALNLPTVIVPALAPTILGAHDDNYPLLWGIAAVFCFIGALLMPLIKGVK
ncbi:MFS transporter [Actinomyces sp. MRS3W]|uniref:MFS transporter n=1 Tax=Actinomyces sp. MRS3W TaxID=2800796 RepID=UPI0028FD492F|nr:MFS transporter [Actinomyces sp. MRS3W]MDU0349118.1 MFS transporter [Actinomyces sp. MRS3W]